MVVFLGRSFLHIPQDLGANLKSDVPPEKCFIPKRQIHEWKGHSKGKKSRILILKDFKLKNLRISTLWVGQPFLNICCKKSLACLS